jgi:hypothetical protein
VKLCFLLFWLTDSWISGGVKIALIRVVTWNSAAITLVHIIAPWSSCALFLASKILSHTSVNDCRYEAVEKWLTRILLGVESSGKWWGWIWLSTEYVSPSVFYFQQGPDHLGVISFICILKLRGDLWTLSLSLRGLSQLTPTYGHAYHIHSLGWVYIRVRGPKYPLIMYLTFGLKTGPNLEDWSLKLERSIFLSGDGRNLARKWCQLQCIFAYLGLGPWPPCKLLGRKFFYRAIGSLDFGVSFVLDPNLNSPLLLYESVHTEAT